MPMYIITSRTPVSIFRFSSEKQVSPFSNEKLIGDPCATLVQPRKDFLRWKAIDVLGNSMGDFESQFCCG